MKLKEISAQISTLNFDLESHLGKFESSKIESNQIVEKSFEMKNNLSKRKKLRDDSKNNYELIENK